MTSNSHTKSGSHGDKENMDQGNAEVSAAESSDDENEYGGVDLLNQTEFREKYEALQQQWQSGHRSLDELTEEDKAKFGKHAYLLNYCFRDDTEAMPADIAFHPEYSYTYTNFDKDKILPQMSVAQLKATQHKFQSHIDRLEKGILKKLKAKEEANDRKAKEEEIKEAERIKSGAAVVKSTRDMGWIVPQYSVPIRADIRQFPFAELAAKQKQLSGRLFDAIMMDPPWMLATANPTRGVALGYAQLSDADIIASLPIQLLQENGLLFMWIINAKYRLSLQLFQQWGYTMIGDISWVKQTVNRRIANGHGYYLQHAKETCLVGLKGDFDKIRCNKTIQGMCSDVIYSERRGQSQKPEEVYQYVEQLIPNGFYMEIFARRNNLRDGWFSIGNEL